MPEEVLSFTVKIGPPKLTRYEKARIISARALQLALGAPPLIDVSNLSKDLILIAQEELRRGVLPITIKRTKPGGEYQLIPIKILLELEKKYYREIS